MPNSIRGPSLGVRFKPGGRPGSSPLAQKVLAVQSAEVLFSSYALTAQGGEKTGRCGRDSAIREPVPKKSSARM